MYGYCAFFSGWAVRLPMPQTQLSRWDTDRPFQHVFTAGWHGRTTNATPTFRCDTCRPAPAKGIKQISHELGDFGAGEVQLTEQERKEGGVIELPVVFVGIVPIYNLPGIHQELPLSGRCWLRSSWAR